MKKYFITLICVLATFIFLARYVHQTGFYLPQGSSQEFRQKYKPIAEINFSEIYGEGSQFQVLHPLLSFTKLHVSSCTNCSEKSIPLEQGREAMALEGEKRKVLESFLYSKRPLPENFFSQPPFTDQWGSSFAHLISLSIQDRDWVIKHLSFFKISELKEILAKYQINDIRFQILSRLSEAEIESAIRGEKIILTADYVLYRDQARLGFSPLSYSVYASSDFARESQTQAYFYRYSFAIVLLVGLIIFISFAFYLKSLYEKNKAQIKHRLSLQVLSHEFRTPVSAMLLMVDQLERQQNQLSEENQDLVTRMSTEIYRLQRIIEVSKTYLQTESHRIHFKQVEIPSINSWIIDFAAELNQNLKCELLEEDQSLVTDPFWFKFILSNLVQNAFLHGHPTVTLKLKSHRNKLHMIVEDQGQCDFDSLDQMTEAFVKNNRSQGMGLGLNMILFIIKECGAELDFSKNPTTFTLKVRSHG